MAASVTVPLAVMVPLAAMVSPVRYAKAVSAVDITSSREWSGAVFVDADGGDAAQGVLASKGSSHARGVSVLAFSKGGVGDI